jgi:pimeloyl-ACP methyl ester carboxylesterase
MVYKSIHGVTRLVGQGVDAALAGLLPLLEPSGPVQPGSPQRETVLAILNGVMGDHLVASGNPLATPMTLRHQGHVLHWAEEPRPAHLAGARGKVLLMIHGLCMNDLQWHTEKEGVVVDHGETIAAALGYTPLYLRYNTGLHTSQNGHLLAEQLEHLVQNWPVPLEEISVLVHSMGGLLIRSAVQVAQQAGLRWPERLGSLVFLGTPHHGAPLERAGNWVDTILDSTPFTAPFSRLGKLRSAGITDLRYGHVLDADWQGHDRFHRKPDTRQPLPLPEGVACYTVAATLAPRRGALAERLTGDGLVPLNSALGLHDDPARSLVFARESQWIAFGTGHMALLSRPEVTQQVLKWLQPVPPAD